ncbi:DMT family transporter [Pseudahrensia aquimaris]|uniref:DMT family transporter n=1 Tax=Pseudahrensia aquimaris TaxID=744461 RepID=A0ABW3FH44_9HYPH
MSELRATLFGIGAILLWSLLALLTAMSGDVPPFQLTAICFAIATIIGAVALVQSGAGFAPLRQPWPVWLLGVGGLFGYHFFYFTALRNAPPVEAGLIAYLWPLLIILFSALLPGERLLTRHVIGGLVGLSGAYLIVTKGAGLALDPAHTFGYAMAAACALTWSSYSVLSRRFAEVPSAAVTGFCAVAAVLATFAHFGLETTQWPTTPLQWMATLGLGLGPVGLAFYIWDIGVKRGNIQLLGSASYAAPVLSTIALLLAGFGAFTWHVAAAALLVTLGAVIASWKG